MVNAEEWLARSDANALKPRQDGPPHLPRRSARDHLSERNREHALYDPANPSVRTRVRVTQRTSFDDCSLAGRRRMIAHERDDTEARQRALRAEADAEVVAAAEANELLELRSMGIRSVQAGSTRQAASSSSPAVTRSAQAKKAAARSSERPSPSTPPVDTWGSDNGSAPPLAAGQATAGWQVARRNYRPPPMIDGKPMDLVPRRPPTALHSFHPHTHPVPTCSCL